MSELVFMDRGSVSKPPGVCQIAWSGHYYKKCFNADMPYNMTGSNGGVGSELERCLIERDKIIIY